MALDLKFRQKTWKCYEEEFDSRVLDLIFLRFAFEWMVL